MNGNPFWTATLVAVALALLFLSRFPITNADLWFALVIAVVGFVATFLNWPWWLRLIAIAVFVFASAQVTAMVGGPVGWLIAASLIGWIARWVALNLEGPSRP